MPGPLKRIRYTEDVFSPVNNAEEVEVAAASVVRGAASSNAASGYQERVPAVDRAVQVLRCVVQAERGQTLAELSRATRVTPSSLLAILNTLRRHALVRRSEPDGRYFAGPGLLALGAAAAQRLSAASTFNLVAEGLVRRTGETALLWVRHEGSSYLLAAVRESEQPLRYVPAPGAQFDRSVPLAAEAGLFDSPLDADSWQVAVPLPYPHPGAAGPPALLAVAGPATRVRENLTIREALRDALHQLHGEAADAAVSSVAGPVSRPELDAFLGQGHVANLSYLSADGYPATVPLWYHWDGASFWFLPRPGAEWPHHVQRQPRVSLAISESESPLRRVLARGSAEVVADPGGRLRAEVRGHIADRYAARDADHFLDHHSRASGALLRLTPERLLSWRGLLHHPRFEQPGATFQQSAPRRRRQKDSA